MNDNQAKVAMTAIIAIAVAAMSISWAFSMAMQAESRVHQEAVKAESSK